MAQGSVADLSPPWPDFDPREICRGQSGTETSFLPIISIVPANIIPTTLFMYLLLQEGQTGETWEPSKKKSYFLNRGAMGSNL
jgi:hypothetical protein